MADLLIHDKIRVTCGHVSKGACRACITRDLVDPLDARIEALEKERKTYLVAILPEGADAIQRIASRIVEQREQMTTELADGFAALASREDKQKCPDKLTAGALARLIEANKVPSPWRDTGTRLRAFGKWLAALAGKG